MDEKCGQRSVARMDRLVNLYSSVRYKHRQSNCAGLLGRDENDGTLKDSEVNAEVEDVNDERQRM